MINIKPYIFVAIAAISALGGYKYADNSWQVKMSKANDKVRELELKNSKLETKSAEVTTTEVIKYVDKIKVVKEKGETIYKEIPIYVTSEADNNCTITNGFVSVYNRSAAGNRQTDIPDTPGDPNAASPSIKLSTVAETTVKNHLEYHQLAEQLHSLQNWILEQQKIWGK